MESRYSPPVTLLHVSELPDEPLISYMRLFASMGENGKLLPQTA